MRFARTVRCTRSRTCRGVRRRHFFRRSSSDGPAYKLNGADSRLWDRVDPGSRDAIVRLETEREGLPLPNCRKGMLKTDARRERVGLIITAPPTMSLDAARDHFLGLLYEYRYRIHVGPRLDPTAKGFSSLNLGDVERLDLDAALVLTAEYHRNCMVRGYKPYVDDQDWKPEVVRLLEDLGFYDFVGARGRTGCAQAPSSAKRFVKFISGKRVQGEQADSLIEALRVVAGVAPAREAIYAALVEAIMNVTSHAYKDRPPAVYPVREHWWAAGAYDPTQQTLEFVVYDQGVGIPARLPRSGDLFTRIWTFVKGEGDSALIDGAIEYGRTSTNLEERGNGLWMICRLAEELDGSSVRILSGRGDVTYFSRQGSVRKDHANPFCGTLIKWTLKLPPEPTSAVGEAL